MMEHKDLLTRCKSQASIWKTINGNSIVNVYECVADALESIKKIKADSSVLVTGSLHLVGATLSIIDPNLNKD